MLRRSNCVALPNRAQTSLNFDQHDRDARASFKFQRNCKEFVIFELLRSIESCESTSFMTPVECPEAAERLLE